MEPTFSDSFAKAQQLNGVSLSSFLASVSTSVIIFIVEVLLYFGICRWLPEIYPAVTQPICIPITDLLRLDCSDGHFDKYFFRRYVRTLFLLFFPAAFLITPVLVPLNRLHGKGATKGVSGLDTLGWSNVGLEQSDRYWVHLVMSLIFVSYVCCIIWLELTKYVELRQKSPYAALNTVLIDSIPPTWMAKEYFVSHFEAFPGAITSVSFNRDFRTLSQAVAKREQMTRSLELAETRHIQQAYRARSGQNGVHYPSLEWKNRGLASWFKLGKVDSVSPSRKQLRDICERIEIYKAELQRFPQLRSAFISFENPIAAHMVCQTVIHTESGYMTPCVLPISRDDIVWDNVCIPWGSRIIRTVASNVLVAGAAVLCVVPAAFIGLLSQIVYIAKAVEWLSWINNLPEWSLGLLQGVLPPTLLAVLAKGFASVVEYLVRKQGIPTKSNIDLKIQDIYFCFLFFQTTLVVSLSAGITAIMNEVGGNGPIAAILAKNLPKASNYFLSYVLLQALSVSANSLLRIDHLIGRFLLAPIFDKTVTEMMVRKRGVDINWGTFIPFYTNLSCIGFLYAIISPIILPFQALAFLLFLVTCSRSAIILTKRDSGGLFYPKALKHLVVGLYVMEISLIGLFLLVRDSHGDAICIGQACFMTIALALTTVYHRLLCRTFNPRLLFTPTSVKPYLGSPPSSAFHHKALRSSSVIRLPGDEHGITSAKALQIRAEVPGIAVHEHEGILCQAGSISLKT